MKKNELFNFQNLIVWQKAIEFSELVIKVIDKIKAPRNHFRLIEQMESASTSVAMNIAEGKGRQTTKEFIQFLYIARGSLFEVVTLLIILKNAGWLECDEFNRLQDKSEEIAKMINSLISSMKKKIS